MIDEIASVEQNAVVHGQYYRLILSAPEIAALAQPGQFVHLLIPELESRMLRRPFSIHRAEAGRIQLLYKPVGIGTHSMTALAVGSEVSIVGPLGRGFPLDCADALPVLVAGGYGMAALFMLAQRLPRAGVVFAGGATVDDILCRDEFDDLGWPVWVATENGTLGERGLVTAPLDAWLKESAGSVMPVFYACGPHGMLRAVAQRADSVPCRAWVSLDRHMGCGVGACLACVQKMRSADGTVRWGRVCREGPVFDSKEIVWDE